MGECLLGVSLDEGFDESSFADTRRSHHRNDDGWRLFRQPIDEGYMEPLFFDLEVWDQQIVRDKFDFLETHILGSCSLLVESPRVCNHECFGVSLYRI